MLSFFKQFALRTDNSSSLTLLVRHCVTWTPFPGIGSWLELRTTSEFLRGHEILYCDDGNGTALQAWRQDSNFGRVLGGSHGNKCCCSLLSDDRVSPLVVQARGDEGETLTCMKACAPHQGTISLNEPPNVEGSVWWVEHHCCNVSFSRRCTTTLTDRINSANDMLSLKKEIVSISSPWFAVHYWQINRPRNR